MAPQDIVQAALRCSTISKAALLADSQAELARRLSPRQVACQAGCDHCCWETIAVSLAEIDWILEHIGAWPEQRLEQLKTELARYEKEMVSQRANPIQLRRSKCALLEDGVCSVYQNRPFACRARHTFDVDFCAASKLDPGESANMPGLSSLPHIYQAARAGYEQGHKQTPNRYELCCALKILLETPGVQLTPMPRPEPPKEFSFSPLPKMTPPSADVLALLDAGEFDRADKLLDQGNVLHLFARLKMPAMYESEVEILESRNRFSETLDMIEQLDFPPEAGLVGLMTRQSYEIAYQGQSVRELLAKQGKLLCSIAERALPHLAQMPAARQGGRPRVGYISHNMRHNNGCRWALGWLKSHGSAFETFAFNLGAVEDAVSLKFKAAADHYFRVVGDTKRAAEFIRNLDLDVLIFTDIGLAMGDYRFATLRLARHQCTAWGHPVTSGLPTIDFYLSSELMEPEGAESEYTEKLIRLPNAGLAFERPVYNVPTVSRQALGLPGGYLPFMAQATLKWTPGRDELIAKIAERHRLPLILVSGVYTPGNDKFKRRMARYGVNVELLPRMDRMQFNRCIRAVDVSYDPPDWSGGNTTLEALHSGVPVVTWPGRFMRGRHSLAFLELAGMQGLVATDENDYVDLVFDRERQLAAFENGDSEVLYGDKVASAALNDFLSNLALG